MIMRSSEFSNSTQSVRAIEGLVALLPTDRKCCFVLFLAATVIPSFDAVLEEASIVSHSASPSGLYGAVGKSVDERFHLCNPGSAPLHQLSVGKRRRCIGEEPRLV